MNDRPAFLDTNIFIRQFVQDDRRKAERCRRLFESLAEPGPAATTSESVLAEVMYVLTSPRIYHVPRAAARALLLSALGLPGLALRDRSVYIRALDLFLEHPALDFEGALSAAHVEQGGLPTLVSYDHDFDRIPSVNRSEP